MNSIKRDYKVSPWNPRKPYGVRGLGVYMESQTNYIITLSNIISYSMKTYVYRYGVRGVRFNIQHVVCGWNFYV